MYVLEDDNNVVINGKHYADINDYTIVKLEHMLQLINIDIDNYKRFKKYSKDYLSLLEKRKERIQIHIGEKLKQNRK